MSEQKKSEMTAASRRKFDFRRIPNLGLLLVFLVIVVVFMFISPNFMTVSNWTNLLRQLSVLMLLACGQTLVILTAGIDLSIGALMGLVSVVVSYTLLSFNPLLAIVFGLCVGILVGVVNGLLIGKLNITPFIATLGSMTVIGGLAMVITNGTPVHGLPNTWFFDLGRGYVGPVPIPVIIAFVGVVLTYIILNQTKFGRYLFAIGGNEEAAKLAGINVSLVKIGTYAFAGMLSGVASLILTARVITGQPQLGSGMELDSIAAVVIGGTSLMGGIGSIGGTVIGVLIIGVLKNGLTLLGVSTFMQQVVIGLMLIFAILLSTMKIKGKFGKKSRAG
jgi:inositol transport system permease protein